MIVNNFNSEMMELRFDSLQKLKLRLPQNLPAIKKIQHVEINMLDTESYTLIDQVIFDCDLEILITYLGLDNQIHLLSDNISLLKKYDKPRGIINKSFNTNFTIQHDYHLKLPKEDRKRQKTRQFNIVILVRLICQLEYFCEAQSVYQKQSKLRKRKKFCNYRSPYQYKSHQKRSYPWKKIGPEYYS